MFEEIGWTPIRLRRWLRVKRFRALREWARLGWAWCGTL